MAKEPTMGLNGMWGGAAAERAKAYEAWKQREALRAPLMAELEDRRQAAWAAWDAVHGEGAALKMVGLLGLIQIDYPQGEAPRPAAWWMARFNDLVGDSEDWEGARRALIYC